MTRKRTVGVTLFVIGVLMIGASLLLVLWNETEGRRAEKAAEAVLPFLEVEIEKRSDEDSDILPPDPAFDEMTVVGIDGCGYIGYLLIPALDLELPVMSEWDYSRLRVAPCRYYGSVNTDDLVIAAHNYTQHFGMLKNLSAGDEVYFIDMDGITYDYTVGSIETLNPTDVKQMVESEWDLTLYTCTYGGRQRVTVRCKRGDSHEKTSNRRGRGKS